MRINKAIREYMEKTLTTKRLEANRQRERVTSYSARHVSKNWKSYLKVQGWKLKKFLKNIICP